MSLVSSLNVSASGLTAQSLRMDVLSENVANANTTKGSDGGPYKRQTVLFQEIGKNNNFDSFLQSSTASLNGVNGVRVNKIVKDETPGALVYDPSHPDANESGYVQMPNVNIVEEMTNMISASRSYEANVTAINTTKSMIAKTLEIGR